MVIITLAYQLSATLTGGSQVTSDLDHLPIIGTVCYSGISILYTADYTLLLF